MNSRRDFFKSVAGATAGMYVMGTGGRAAAQARRQVSIAGKRVRVVDVHAHCDVPLGEVVKGTKYQNQADQDPELEERIPLMDKQGVDVQALSINGFWWYEITDRGLARAVCNRQNEELAKWVKAHPDRFVAMASVPLQFPDLAAEVLQDAVTKLGARGVTLGGHVNGEDLSLPKFDPFWAKAAEMNELVFMHPGGSENIIKDNAFRGRGGARQHHGNPLETTYFLSRLIFDGCSTPPAAQGLRRARGRLLAVVLGRTEAACDVRATRTAPTRAAKEYLRSQIMMTP